MIKSLLFSTLAALPALLPTDAQALSGGGGGDMVSVTLLPGWRTDSGTHMTALKIDLADGWKTYWRAPGEAGIPPQFDWSGSENIESVEIHWPRPEMFEANGMRSIGYHDVVLPLEFTPSTPDAPMTLTATVSMGVCETVCVPIELKVDAQLPETLRTRDRVIESAIQSQPESEAQAGLRSATCHIEPIRDGLRVTAELELPQLGGEELAVFELPDTSIWVSEASTSRNGMTVTATADMVPQNAQPFALSRSDLRITLLAQNRAVNIEGCSS